MQNNFVGKFEIQIKDLAARNILVNKDGICKVSDFGLARKVGFNSTEDAYTFTGGKVPIRWTAPEAIIYRKFTISSDIWSFGIVMWEIFSLGERPYWNWTNQAVIGMLEKGYRLPLPNNCPLNVYQLMQNCWINNPDKRPTFKILCKQIDELIESQSVATNEINSKSNNLIKQKSPPLRKFSPTSIKHELIKSNIQNSKENLNDYTNNDIGNHNQNENENDDEDDEAQLTCCVTTFSNDNQPFQSSRNSSYKIYTSFSSSSNTYFNTNSLKYYPNKNCVDNHCDELIKSVCVSPNIYTKLLHNQENYIQTKINLIKPGNYSNTKLNLLNQSEEQLNLLSYNHQTYNKYDIY